MDGHELLIRNSSQINASGWNTYKGKITDLRIRNRGRDSKIISGLLDNKKSIPKEALSKLNAHTDAISGNLCACSRITSKNKWHGIGACYV